MQKYAPVYRFLMAKSLSKRMKRFKGAVWLGDYLILPFGRAMNQSLDRPNEKCILWVSCHLKTLYLLNCCLVEPTGSQANRASSHVVNFVCIRSDLTQFNFLILSLSLNVSILLQISHNFYMWHLKMLDSAWLFVCSRRNIHAQKPF